MKKKIKGLIFLVVFNLLFSNLVVKAETFEKINVTQLFDAQKPPLQEIMDVVASSSVFRFDIPVDPNQKWVLVSAKKSDTEALRMILDIKDGVLTGDVYLPYGPGLYTFTMWYLYDKSKDISGGYEYLGKFTIQNKDTRNLKYILPDGNIQCDNMKIRSLASSIIKGKTGDMAKTLAIHDWVAKNISYDVKNYFNKSMNRIDYSALGVLKIKTSICSGYANLVAALNRAVGIRTKVIGGKVIWLSTGETWAKSKGSDHAWNETYIDGKWIIQDATWDAGYVNFTKKTFTFKLGHTYFNPKESVFAKDHKNTSE
jgi:transglutaminase-like putative cysteine protease